MRPEDFANFMAGSPLNRLSWLRTSHSFINAIISSSAARWILFNGGQPLIATDSSTQKRTVALLPTDVVRPLLGSEPYFGQGQHEGEACSAKTSTLESARLHGPRIVFLGLDEMDSDINGALPSSDFSNTQAAIANLHGTPFLTVDVADLGPSLINEVIRALQSDSSDRTLAFMEPRAAMTSLDMFTAAVFAEARSMVDWNERNKFCPACGSPLYSLWAGWKLSCTSLLPWADNQGKNPCPSSRGLQNYCHPRTDPVVIMVTMDETGEKILLGRNKKFLPKFYSALAGFVEPGESYEDAVRREMWEEAGVKVWDIRYHSGQPWPYPANLMLGFFATADAAAPIRTDLDNELEDARWYTRQEVLAALTHTAVGHRKAAEAPELKFPSPTALAGAMIKQWAEGNIRLGYAERGNL